MRLRPESFAFTLLLGVFAGLPALSIDLSAPTLVLLPAALDTNVTVAGLSLSLFMVGFAVGQFVGGRASDRRGRRPVLLFALLVYAASGVICALAASGLQLVAGRLLQGAAAGACSVQASAIVQDLFRGEAARRKQSYVTGVFSVLPMLAPALGAMMIVAWGWRSVHAVLAAAGLALCATVALLMVETRPETAPRPGPHGTARPNVGTAGLLLRDPWFRVVAVANALSYGTVFAYIAGGPVVVMTQMGYAPAIYAAVFAATALALSAGAWTSAALGRRGLVTCNLVSAGLLLQAGSTLALALACAGVHACGPGVILPPLLATCFARGLVSPNMVHLGISSQREHAGFASALLGLTQLLVGAGASAVVAFLLPRYGLPGLAGPMAMSGCAAAVLWLTAARDAKRAQADALAGSRDR